VVILIGGGSRYWSRHLYDRVTLKHTLSERRAFIDEPVTLDLELANAKPLPLPWYEWRLAMSEPFSVEGEMLAGAAAPGIHWLVRRGALGWYEKHQWQVTVRTPVRGYHQVGPATLKSADLLGMFPSRHDLPDMEHITVFPRVFSMEDLGLPADRPFGDRKGRNRLFEDPLRISGTRDYRPGDPLKRIDWKATARSGELQARVYEPSATQQLYILVNIDTMEHVWEGYLRDDLERTVSTAASVAVWAAGQRFAVGILANGSFPDADRPIRLAPSRSPDQLTRLLEALAVIQPLTLSDLAGAIHREGGRMPAGSTIICVASLMPPPLAGALARLSDEGHEVFVLATSDRVAGSVPAGIPVHTVGRAFERQVASP
jgi:uncharacterized protein (DUF58 family)